MKCFVVTAVVVCLFAFTYGAEFRKKPGSHKSKLHPITNYIDHGGLVPKTKLGHSKIAKPHLLGHRGEQLWRLGHGQGQQHLLGHRGEQHWRNADESGHHLQHLTNDEVRPHVAKHAHSPTTTTRGPHKLHMVPLTRTHLHPQPVVRTPIVKKTMLKKAMKKIKKKQLSHSKDKKSTTHGKKVYKKKYHKKRA